MASNDVIHVEVAYALPTRQQIVRLELAPGTTVREAALRSGLDKQFPDLDLQKADLGVFGKVVSNAEQETVKDGDRVEIYRALIADPKEARKQRAAKVKERKAGS